jgi:hypothetical protein
MKRIISIISILLLTIPVYYNYQNEEFTIPQFLIFSFMEILIILLVYMMIDKLIKNLSNRNLQTRKGINNCIECGSLISGNHKVCSSCKSDKKKNPLKEPIKIKQQKIKSTIKKPDFLPDDLFNEKLFQEKIEKIKKERQTKEKEELQERFDSFKNKSKEKNVTEKDIREMDKDLVESFIFKYQDLKSYTSKLDGTVLKGNPLKNLIELSGGIYFRIKGESILLQKNNQKGYLINGKIIYDWECIKLFIKNIDQKDKIIFGMNLECIGFCDFEFGKLSREVLLYLMLFGLGKRTEEKLDEKFLSYFLKNKQ